MATDSTADGTAHSARLPETVEIDPRGDLTLVVGAASRPSHPEPVAFRVCSRTVARAARAFDVMLYGNFAEARQPASDWTVRLPDDDPKAMEKLLHLMHGRFGGYGDFPTRRPVDFFTLYDMTIIADKYDLAHLFCLWADRLINVLEYWVDRFPGEKLLWVSWVLGSPSALKSVMEKLAWECTAHEPSMRHEPPGALETILQMRRELIDDLMKPVTSTVTALIAGTLPDRDYLQCRKGGNATSVCNLVTLASLIQDLHALKLWPLPDSETWTGSASRLRNTLDRLRILRDPNHQIPHSLECPHSLLKDGHTYWCPKTSAVLTGKQLDHLSRQAVKTGLPTGF